MSSETDSLLLRIARGDQSAMGPLLARHEKRLRDAIQPRINRRAAARFGVSDVLQDSFSIAVQRLPQFALTRPVSFYVWLRQIAFERLIDLHRKHIQARGRSVLREEPLSPAISDDGLATLADLLVDPQEGPADLIVGREEHSQLQDALRLLPDGDREIISMRYLERMSAAEIASVLAIGERAAKSRIRRAIERLHKALKRPDMPNP